MSRVVLAAAVLLPLSGCLSRPVVQDPLAGFALPAEPSPALQKLSVAAVISENTRNSVAQARQAALQEKLNLKSAVDPDSIVEDALAVLRRNFRSVTVVDSPAAAASVGTDLIAVVDVIVDFEIEKTASTFLLGVWASPPRSIVKVDFGTIFLTPGRRQVDKVRGEAMVVLRARSPRWREILSQAMAQAAAKYEAALRDSLPLAAVAEPPSAGPGASRARPERSYASEVDSPGYRKPEREDRFALVIGIERYASLPAADFAARDAAAVRAHLRALGTPDRHIVFLTDQQAGKASIEKYVEEWLPEHVRPGAKLFVYFSGHGSPDPVAGTAYLVPWDGDPKYLGKTAYPVARLYSHLAKLPAKEVVVALDACFSGAGGRSVIPKGTRPLVARVESALPAKESLAVLSAAAADEITGTDEGQGHGLFTYHLLRALNARKGEATPQELYADLLPRVRDAARLENRDQTPQLAPLGSGRNPL